MIKASYSTGSNDTCRFVNTLIQLICVLNQSFMITIDMPLSFFNQKICIVNRHKSCLHHLHACYYTFEYDHKPFPALTH